MSVPEERILGSYRLVERIGKGGMGEVYRAQHLKLGREAAIKILPVNLAGEEDFLKRFEREAASAGSLDHPNILAVWEYGEQQGAPYLVMPYVRSGTLKERLKQGPLSRQEIAGYLTQMADALDYAHDRGIVHRDVKPANMLLDERGRLFLSDFGIAKALEGAEGLTKTGIGVGTPEYMAPEQAQGIVDARSDLYALGVILYQMLAGQVPYKGNSTVEVLMKHMQDPLPLLPLRAVAPPLPPGVEQVLQQALAKNPNDRFQTGHALAEAFQAAAGAATPTAVGQPWQTGTAAYGYATAPPAGPGATPPPGWSPGATAGGWTPPSGQAGAATVAGNTPPKTPLGAGAPAGATPTDWSATGATAGWQAGATPYPPAATPLPATPPAPPPANRRPLLLGAIAALVILLLLVGAGGLYAATRPNTQATATAGAAATGTVQMAALVTSTAQAAVVATGTAAAVATATASAPTATPVPPTATTVPPTATTAPPTPTAVPPTATAARATGPIQLAVSPAAGPAGTSFVVTGSGFTPGETIHYTVTAPNGATNEGTIPLTAKQDNFQLTLTSKTDYPTGVYTVAFTRGDGSPAGTVSFTVR
ncbi:MAG TPA: serine/threonine-protein kinase [Thermomicrobiales bacterium]|nr:serine/threonine-protein kinase [Thermomicrobiales bacterium]